MTLDFNNLPNNADVLRQMVIELATQLEANERRLERIQNIIEQLLRWRHGQKREKLDENQLFLFAVGLETSGQDVQDFITDIDQDQEEKAGDQNGKGDPLAAGPGDDAKPRGHGRKPLPRTLRRERIEYDLDEAERQCPCCAQTMRRIGEEVGERLEYVPASMKVMEEARGGWYACSCGGAVKTAPKPPAPIEKGLAGASLLAQVAVAKYATMRRCTGRK